ncbi:hypothetical protein BDW74DRAFT_172634 [Aspergillus multicolor]|uniref:uncharacterized protein n=1 Tax=Aspergillus multicolor TaxID=41759 RepID=UPI003CCE3377
MDNSNTEKEDQEVMDHVPSLETYDQPTSSPYESEPITIKLGYGPWSRYTIPRAVLDQHLAFPKPDSTHTITLQYVDSDIGHTLVHYLYTGTYQTLRLPLVASPEFRDKVEYNRSVLTYRAAFRYGLDGLAEQAKKYMKVFNKHVSLSEILYIAAEVFVPESRDAWFSAYLTETLKDRFEEDEDVFRDDGFIEAFGTTPEFSQFLAKLTTEIYADQVARLREICSYYREKNTNANVSRPCVCSDMPSGTGSNTSIVSGESEAGEDEFDGFAEYGLEGEESNEDRSEDPDMDGEDAGEEDSYEDECDNEDMNENVAEGEESDEEDFHDDSAADLDEDFGDEDSDEFNEEEPDDEGSDDEESQDSWSEVPTPSSSDQDDADADTDEAQCALK